MTYVIAFFIGAIVGSIITFVGIYYLGSLNKKNSADVIDSTSNSKNGKLPENDINLLKNKFPQE